MSTKASDALDTPLLKQPLFRTVVQSCQWGLGKLCCLQDCVFVYRIWVRLQCHGKCFVVAFLRQHMLLFNIQVFELKMSLAQIHYVVCILTNYKYIQTWLSAFGETVGIYFKVLIPVLLTPLNMKHSLFLRTYWYLKNHLLRCITCFGFYSCHQFTDIIYMNHFRWDCSKSFTFFTPCSQVSYWHYPKRYTNT